MSSKNGLKKIVIIIVGSVIAAYGITLALYAGFGGATLAVLWQGISETFHISIGMASFVVAIVMILFAVGTGLYASASLGRGSYEAVTFALAEKNNWQVKIVRMILDILMVVTGVLLGGKFGACTIITVIISGPVIQFTNGKAKQILI